MVLAKQNIPLQLVQGLNRGTSDALRSPETLREGVNVEQLKTGRIQKRKGFDAFATNGDAKFLFPSRGSVGVFENNNQPKIYSLDGLTESPVATSSNFPPYLNMQRFESEVIPFAQAIKYPSLDNAGLATTFKTFYLETEQTYDTNLNNLRNPSAFGPDDEDRRRYIPETTVHLTLDDSANQLTLGNAFSTTTFGVGGSKQFDGDVFRPLGTQLAIAFDDGSNIVAALYNGTTLVASTNVASSANLTHLDVFNDGNITNTNWYIVASFGSGGSRVYRIDSTATLVATLPANFGETAVYIGTGIATDTDLEIFITVGDGTPTLESLKTRRAINVSKTFGTGTTSANVYRDRAILYSKPRALSANEVDPVLLVPSLDSDGVQNAYLYRDSRYKYGFAVNFNTSGPFWLSDWITLADGRDFTILRTIGEASFQGIEELRQETSAILSVTPEASSKFARPIEFDDATYFSMGQIMTYDGESILPAGFTFYPDPVQPTNDGSGATPAAGTYFYVAVYEYTDANGDLIESAPSAPVSFAVTGGQVDVTVPSLQAEPNYIQRTIKASVYRTLASGSAGSIFYYIGQAEIGSVGVTIADTISDADLIDRKILYTSGGVVENTTIDNPAAIIEAKDRLWTYTAGTTDRVYFSKQNVRGTIPQFSEVLNVAVDERGGKLTGLASLDDKVLIFKERTVFVIYGDGPSPALVGSFSTPVPILQGMGCVNQRSIVETPIGVIFESNEGFYLINRGLESGFIGRPLYKEQGTILNAGYEPEFNRCFFLSDSQLWLYYVSTGSWYEWTVTSPLDFILSQGERFLLANGKILKQGSNFQDDSVNYVQSMRLGPFQFAGIQGYQRIYRSLFTGPDNGDADSSNITATTYINFDTAVTDTMTIAHDACILSNRFGVEVRTSRQRCEAFEVELSLTSSTSGISIDAASAEVGAIAGSGRRAASRRAN
jgi:hypothetical protein